MKQKKLVLTVLAMSPLSAFAAAPDVSAIVTEITGLAAPVAAIGGAVLTLMVGIKVYKWLRGAM